VEILGVWGADAVELLGEFPSSPKTLQRRLAEASQGTRAMSFLRQLIKNGRRGGQSGFSIMGSPIASLDLDTSLK